MEQLLRRGVDGVRGGERVPVRDALRGVAADESERGGPQAEPGRELPGRLGGKLLTGRGALPPVDLRAVDLLGTSHIFA